jgi:tRNA(His) 5'-end guanylyltransferase
MRGFEQVSEIPLLPEVWVVVRLEVRRFEAVRRELGFREPFDDSWMEALIETLQELTGLGIYLRYGHIQGPELSVLLDSNERSFGRRGLKLATTLAGVASSKLSVLLGRAIGFQATLSQLPDRLAVVDYFRWRMGLSERNALNSLAYWALRRSGQDAAGATLHLDGMSGPEKLELLTASGTSFEEVSTWKRRGVGMHRSVRSHEGTDPRSGLPTVSKRIGWRIERDLPGEASYSRFLSDQLV